MARVAIPVTALGTTGSAPPAQTNADATNKHTLDNATSRTVLEVVSSDGADQTVEFELSGVDPNALDGLTVPKRTETIPAGETRIFAKFPSRIYGTTINVNPSVSTTLKFRAYKG